MISHYLQSLTGSDLIGEILLLGSIAVFIGIVVWALRADRTYIAAMKNLPLEHTSAEPKGPREEGS